MLSINAVPIIYQAAYREQEIVTVRNEIENLISQIETTVTPSQTASTGFLTNDVNIEEKLLKEFIPNMLYSRKEPAFQDLTKQFKEFMIGYRYKEDIDTIVGIIAQSEDLTQKDYKLLELYAKKIASVKSENYTALEEIKQQIDAVQKQS